MSADPAAAADRLRALHQPGRPLVLVNVWDAASAQRVEAAGAAAIGTSSAAVAASLGVPDDRSAVVVVFEAVSRIAASVTLPVTADLFDGYGLPASELVERLLAAGAVGCNLEDSDHLHPGRLLDPGVAADRVAEVRAAAQEHGVPVVVNARIDTYLYAAERDAGSWADISERARRYIDAGADCAYPVRLTDPALVAALCTELGAPVNANLASGGRVSDLAAAGASRISIGPQAHGVALAALDRLAQELLERVSRD